MIENGRIGCGSNLAYPFFLTFIIMIHSMLLSVLVAFVLDSFMRSSKLNMNILTKEDYQVLIHKWQDYDPKATGWIKPQDVAFLFYELPKPLGKSVEYNDILYQIIELNNEERGDESSKLIDDQQRFIINEEKNMVLPTRLIMSILQQLDLPIYVHPEGHKCHFKDVAIQLTKRVLWECEDYGDADLEEDLKLKDEWIERYPDLRKVPVLKQTQSGQFLAGIFIGSLIQKL